MGWLDELEKYGGAALGGTVGFLAGGPMGGIAGAGLGYGLGSGLNDTGGGTGTGGNMSGSTNQYYQPTPLQQQLSAQLLKQYGEANPYTTGAGADLGRQLSDMSRSGGGIGSLANDLSSQYNNANIPNIAGTLGGTKVPDLSGYLQSRMNTPNTNAQMNIDPTTQGLMDQMAQGNLQAPQINLDSQTQGLMSQLAKAKYTDYLAPTQQYEAGLTGRMQNQVKQSIGDLAAQTSGMPTNAIGAIAQKANTELGTNLAGLNIQATQAAQAQAAAANQAGLSAGMNVAQNNASLLAQEQAMNNARQQAAMSAGLGISQTNAQLSAQDQARKDQLASALTNLGEQEFQMQYGITKDAASAQWQQYEAQVANLNTANQMKLTGAQQQIGNQASFANLLASQQNQGNQYQLGKAGLLTDLYSGETSQQNLAYQKAMAAQNQSNYNNSQWGGLFNNVISTFGPSALKLATGGGDNNNQGYQSDPSQTAQGYYSQHPDWYAQDYLKG